MGNTFSRTQIHPTNEACYESCGVQFFGLDDFKEKVPRCPSRRFPARACKLEVLTGDPSVRLRCLKCNRIFLLTGTKAWDGRSILYPMYEGPWFKDGGEKKKRRGGDEVVPLSRQVARPH